MAKLAPSAAFPLDRFIGTIVWFNVFDAAWTGGKDTDQIQCCNSYYTYREMVKRDILTFNYEFQIFKIYILPAFQLYLSSVF